MAPDNGFGPAPVADRPAFASHLAFEVQNLDDVIASLGQHNIVIKFGPLARGDGMMQLFVHDPDGYLLEFYSWVEGSEANAPQREAIPS